MTTEQLPAPPKPRHRWQWFAGYALALALLAFFAMTVDQTGNNENIWWTAFALIAVGGVIAWRLMTRRTQ